MYPAVQQHRFGEQGEYLLVPPTQDGARRILHTLALRMTTGGVIAGLLYALEGDRLYCEVLLQECLHDAPAHWWTPAPAARADTGHPQRVLSFEAVPVDEFTLVRQEVTAWCRTLGLPSMRPFPSTKIAPSAPPRALPSAWVVVKGALARRPIPCWRDANSRWTQSTG